MVEVDTLDAVWLVQNSSTDKVVWAGVCVTSDGLILTSALRMKGLKVGDVHVAGRSYNGAWTSLQVVHIKERFDMALLKVIPKKKKRASLSYPFIDIGKCNDFTLRRGDRVRALFHQGVPFSFKFASVCRDFRSCDVTDVLPTTESHDTITSHWKSSAQSGIESERVHALTKPLLVLRAVHVIDLLVGADADESGDESEPEKRGSESETSDDESDVEMDEDGTGSEESGRLSDSSTSGSDSGLDEFDDHLRPRLQQLSPDIPIIQVHNLGRGSGSGGGPVFDASGSLIGMYSFHKGLYEYVIPRPFMAWYVRNFAPSSLLSLQVPPSKKLKR